MATKRVKRKISITLEPAVHDTLMRMKEQMPGMTASGVINEILSLSLPQLEELVTTLRAAIDETTGQLDNQRARDEFAKWAGAQMLDLMTEVSDSPVLKSEKEGAA